MQSHSKRVAICAKATFAKEIKKCERKRPFGVGRTFFAYAIISFSNSNRKCFSLDS